MKLQILGVKDWCEWDNATKKPVKRLGTSYTVLKHKAKGPVLVNVKVTGDAVISDETVRNVYKAQVAIWADFTDYEDDVYLRNGVSYYTATATAVVLADDSKMIIDL